MYKIYSFSIIAVLLTFVISFLIKEDSYIFLLGMVCSLYLIISVFYEIFFYRKFFFTKLNLPRLFSHVGFGLLIMAITLNNFFSKEITAKIDLLEEFSSQEIGIKFLDSTYKQEKNFKELFGKYEIRKGKKVIILNPSIRKYVQPQQFTSETSIKNDGFSDFYIAMDYANDLNTGIGIRFYYNYFIRLIWLSFALIIIGGFLSLSIRKNEKKT